MTESAPAAPRDQLFLPDFCDFRMVFAVIVVGELLAFVLVLTPNAGRGSFWNDLALLSLFIQWVALTSAGALCLARPWLRRLGNVAAGLVGYAAVLLVTLALSEAAYWLVAQRVVTVEATAAWQIGAEAHWFAQPRPISLEPAVRWHVEFLLRSVAISAIVTAVALRYFYVQHQWKTNLESESRARIQALQSRIRPHFLFNSMNTIASLARSDPPLAEQVTEDLADLFRVSLSDASVPATLGRELEVARQYLRIEEQRLGGRMRVEWDVGSLPGDALLPGLTLQPLIENAVYHGIEPATDGGEIRVSGRVEHGRVHVRIANPIPNGAGARSREGNRMAQENVSQRLDAFFRGRARLDVAREDGEYAVTVEFPLTERVE